MKKNLVLNLTILGMMFMISSSIQADESTVKLETIVISGNSNKAVCEVTLEGEFKDTSKKDFEIFKKIVEKKGYKVLEKRKFNSLVFEGSILCGYDMRDSKKKSCSTTLRIIDDLDDYALSGLKKDVANPTLNRTTVSSSSEEERFWFSPPKFEEMMLSTLKKLVPPCEDTVKIRKKNEKDYRLFDFASDVSALKKACEKKEVIDHNIYNYYITKYELLKNDSIISAENGIVDWKVQFKNLVSLLEDCLNFSSPGKQAIDVNDSSRNVSPSNEEQNKGAGTQPFNTAIK
ncbi:MAG: hypothetical protein K2Q18_14215 [Bdellovibrionales bacterium]|nr:hypothetical protein [Bdellovibrionales bacterium]